MLSKLIILALIFISVLSCNAPKNAPYIDPVISANDSKMDLNSFEAYHSEMTFMPFLETNKENIDCL